MRKPTELGIADKLSPDAYLTLDNISLIQSSRSRPGWPNQDFIENLELEGESLEICGRLGAGGSKWVYDVMSKGIHFAIAICSIHGSPDETIRRWKRVLHEPQNTSYLRDKGFFVNEICEIKLIKVNNIFFPALFMARFQDHAFSIYDAKNVGDNDNPIIDRKTQLDDDKMLKIMSELADEIAKLIQFGIRLSGDNFNLCLLGDTVHLFFNDLGTMSVEQIPPEDFSLYVQHYLIWAINAFINSFNFDTQENNPYIRDMGKSGSSLWLKMEEAIMQKLRYSTGLKIPSQSIRDLTDVEIQRIIDDYDSNDRNKYYRGHAAMQEKVRRHEAGIWSL